MSSIEWTDVVWNPVVGCSRVSAGCEHCYAERVAHRGMTAAHRGLTVLGKKGPRWTGEVRCLPERLEQPLRWRKPRRVFVNSMSDLFHEDIPFEFIAGVFGVMAACPQHTFQVLTKRDPRPFFEWLDAFWVDPRWPLPNVWLGVSVEDQATAERRIPWLLHAPAAVRWVSYEPALGAVAFKPYLGAGMCAGPCKGFPPDPARPHDHRRHACPGVDWIVIGGESGPGARPFDLAWARSTIEQCRAAGIPVFVKQLGARPIDHAPRCIRDRKGGDPAEWPEDLRVREWPSG